MQHSHGIVHGRFQPPHNGHIKYIMAALKQADHVTIGICTPVICSKEVAATTGYPCTQEENPYAFQERVDMIDAALCASGVPSDRYSFAEFPSDYTGVKTLFPDGSVFFLSKTGTGDNAKATHLEGLGLLTETVITLPYEEWRERSGDIRDGLASGNDSWKQLVPPVIAEYLAKRSA